MSLNIFLFEFKHFYRSKAKVFSYIFFMLLCFYSIKNGYDLREKQQDTINEINTKKQLEIETALKWFDNNKLGPEEKPWVNINDPFWAILYNPTYVVKTPSELFPLGIGQSEQFGFYKQTKRWSSTYDADTVEEISNYERLINGSIDFSFLIFFLLPILIIILTYNINSFEKDLNFHKLILIQKSKIDYWIISRLLFYLFLVLLSINSLIFITGIMNGGWGIIDSILKLILISNTYIICFSIIFYLLNKYGKNSSSVAFKMISIWLIFCVIIPGSVHQYASYKYPVNYMTDFLDTNRQETYDVFKIEETDLYNLVCSNFSLSFNIF